MRKTDLKRCEELLQIKRKELEQEMKMLMEAQINTTIKESTGDLSSYSYHMADQGTDAMEREKAFMFASKAGRFIYHIDEALQRIADGTYGRCADCHKQINPSRLKAVPHARMCIDCKSSEEG